MIPFIDLATQQEKIKADLDRRIQKVLAHGQYIMGPEVFELEEKLAEYVEVNHCVTVANGTDALLIAMMALGIKAGDEVITSPFTFIANAETIITLGAKPVFVDVNPRTFNIEPSLIEAVITDKTKLIMPVSLYGQCAAMDEINAIAEKHGLSVIEDAAQSFGATYKGRKSCSLSTIGCTSFFPSKPLGCYGDGGACFTNDDRLAQTMKQIRLHGQLERYKHGMIGLNGRLDTIQAAILLAKMEIFEQEVILRQQVGARYTDLLQDKVVTPYIEQYNTSIFGQYTIQIENREEVQRKLKVEGIPTMVYYPIPLHLQPVLQYLEHGKGSFPVSEDLSKKVISLPMNPWLSSNEQKNIAKSLMMAL